MILVTGASGAVGSALVDRLVADGSPPVVAGRGPDALGARWPSLEARGFDALDAATILDAVRGVDVVYYLIHSMESGATPFDERERSAATNVARAAADAGVGRIVYLGGLGEDADDLSQHLASRHATGRTLAEHGPPVLELRAAMVVGADSASYRMLADLVDRLPAMVLPKWVDTPTQPIAEQDVISYLAAARDVPLEDDHTIVEIGGADVVTYREMLRTYARMRGKRRMLLGVPLLTPRLSSLWCGLITSVDNQVARPLIDSMVFPTVVRDDRAARFFPAISPRGFEAALRAALNAG
ncbi:MAG TPA: NAD(P)H-binding protein [Actinomycetota bacterium]|nr:NAD(P)H-binding protein [Actinomycetota bacterium]